MEEDFEEYYSPYSKDPLAEIKAAAFEYLLLNPGSDFGDWQDGMLEQYPDDVVDALGNNPPEVFAAFADLWEADYTDPRTGIEQSIKNWALAFATEQSVDLYYRLAEVLSSDEE